VSSHTGTCRLCLKTNVRLMLSHGLPRALYKALRDDHGDGNPNPVTITPKRATQSSRQQTTRLLCHDCEQRFSRNGERWVLSNCLKADRTFPLRELLDLQQPDHSAPGQPTRIYHAVSIPAIDTSALAYFGASMFWRYSVYPWGTDGSYTVKLGPFEEGFRQYLVGDAAFPDSAALWVLVREPSLVDRLTYTPTTGKGSGAYSHRFPMPGFIFMLWVGNRITDTHRELCIFHGKTKSIARTSIVEPQIMEEAILATNRVNILPHA